MGIWLGLFFFLTKLLNEGQKKGGERSHNDTFQQAFVVSLQAGFKSISIKLNILVAVSLKKDFDDKKQWMAQRLWN